MKKKILEAITLCCLIVSLETCGGKIINGSENTMQANEGGNAVDDYMPEHNSAWFLKDTKTVKYCVQVDPSFGVDLNKVEEAVHFAITTWGAYIEKKGVNRNRHLNFDDYLTLAVKFQKLADCKNYDLAFYLGVRNPEIDSILKNYMNPIGIAHRELYRREIGWGKGFIWLAPTGTKLRTPGSMYKIDWNMDDYNLKGILLHELGHVYGNEHVVNTIMDAAPLLSILPIRRSSPPKKNRTLLIDQDRELVRCDSNYGHCDIDWDLNVIDSTFSESINSDKSMNLGKANDKDPETPFKVLTGRNEIGEVRARFVAHTRPGQIRNQKIVLSDDQGSFDLKLSIVLKGPNKNWADIIDLPSYGNAMKAVGDYPGDGSEGGSMVEFTESSDGAIIYQTIEAVSGATFPIIQVRNLGAHGHVGWISFRMHIGGKLEEVFDYRPWWRSNEN